MNSAKYKCRACGGPLSEEKNCNYHGQPTDLHHSCEACDESWTVDFLERVRKGDEVKELTKALEYVWNCLGTNMPTMTDRGLLIHLVGVAGKALGKGK